MLATPRPTPDTEAPASVNGAVRRDVTVVIAAWRAAGTIGRAVASALAQPEAAEVVVVDDASGDDGATLAAARAADDGTGRLQVLALETNSGPAHARNAAIRASKAPWITILDSDDFMEPGRLAKLIALANAAPEGGYDLIADDLKQVEENAPPSTAREMWFTSDDRTPIDISFAYFIGSCITKTGRVRRELGFLKPIVRRSFLETHGLVYDETMRLGEDLDLYARSLSVGARMRLVPWAGYVSVMRRHSLSLNHSRADILALEASSDRLLASGKLTKAEAALVRKHRFNTHARIVWIDFMTAAKSGKVFHAAGVVLKDPRQAPYVLRSLRNMFVQKLTGK